MEIAVIPFEETSFDVAHCAFLVDENADGYAVFGIGLGQLAIVFVAMPQGEIFKTLGSGEFFPGIEFAAGYANELDAWVIGECLLNFSNIFHLGDTGVTIAGIKVQPCHFAFEILVLEGGVVDGCEVKWY